MHYTKIVTSFLKNDEKILILKRSDMVKTMKGLWAGVSGIIEQGETPLVRAKIEIFEEVGLEEWKLGDGRPRGASHIENIRFWDLPNSRFPK